MLLDLALSFGKPVFAAGPEICHIHFSTMALYALSMFRINDSTCDQGPPPLLSCVVFAHTFALGSWHKESWKLAAVSSGRFGDIALPALLLPPVHQHPRSPPCCRTSSSSWARSTLAKLARRPFRTSRPFPSASTASTPLTATRSSTVARVLVVVVFVVFLFLTFPGIILLFTPNRVDMAVQ